MNSEEVGKSVHASLRTELGAETACESLLTQCLEKVYSREKNVWEIGWLMDGSLDRNGTHVDVQMVEKIDTTPATYRETYVLHQIKTENVDRLPKSTDVKDESIDRRTMVKVRMTRMHM